MHNDSIGKRVKYFRENIGLNQEQLSVEIGWDQSAISRIEGNKQEISSRFLNAMMLRFGVNSDWIMTGEGEMYIAPEEFIANGIRFLGEQKYGEGLARIFKDPQFGKLREAVAVEDIQESLSDELRDLLQRVSKVWKRGDEKDRRTLVQLVKAVGENEKNET